MGLLARYRRIWSPIIIGLLWLPMLVQIILPKEQTQSSIEARNLNRLPALPTTIAKWSRFPRKMDAFLADHFGLRRELTDANALLRYALASPTSTEVIYGRDGFLVYLRGTALEQSMGLLMRRKNLEKLADIAATLHNKLSDQNIAFIFASPPNNNTINRSRLPRWAAKVPSLTEYDIVLQLMSERGIPSVDLRPVLERENSRRPTYYHTDTHWNLLGALVARNEILRQVGHPEWMIDVQEVYHGTRAVGGDLRGSLA